MKTSAGARTGRYSVEGLLLDLDGTLVDDSGVAEVIAATRQRVASSHPRLGGIYRLSLVGFPVFFQCKRYRGSVGAGAVRDFRGAMTGRGDKGLLITTGAFTAEAKAEASRPGTPAH